jgi:hypothetical protein
MPLIDLGEQECAVEDQKLYFPSDFNLSERKELGLESLASCEAKLREGDAFDCLVDIRAAVKSISAMRLRKQKSDRGMTQHTQSLAQIRGAEAVRDLKMLNYELTRQALISMDIMDEGEDSQFLKLTEKDLERQPTESGRQLGDSRRSDGRLWVVGAAPADSRGVTSQLLEDAKADGWETEDDNTNANDTPGMKKC